MLRQLYIRNFTLIDELSIEFSPGFSVITGETGAGKSIILGAIGLLLGQRADTKSIKNGKDRCVIEAHFDISRYQLKDFFNEKNLDFDDTDCILRRELTSAGKSRAFVNDTPVQLATMRELGEMLVDIHSQHQNLLLSKEDFQLNVADLLANNQRERDEYRTAFNEWKEKNRQLEDLRREMEQSKANEEFLRFQLSELENARLSEGEQELLEQESETMSHAEEIKSALYETDNALMSDQGIVNQLRQTLHSLRSIQSVYPAAEGYAERMDTCYVELKDMAEEISGQVEGIEFNPNEYERINNRLDTLYTLQKKHRVNSVSELLEIQARFRNQLNQIENFDTTLENLEQQTAKLKTACERLADRLTESRRKAGKRIEEEMGKRLVPLGIPNVRFEVTFQPKPLSPDGADKVAFLFSANKNADLQPIAQVASGGEIARVMLSLKAMISGAVKLPTIIFDEIDTGVSGKTAEKMALIMEEMGHNERQVISITHLPQIAARGSHHYKVYKEDNEDATVSRMILLSKEQRVSEIAQMLSGTDISSAATENARQLLGL